jgi:hypothetical protein
MLEREDFIRKTSEEFLRLVSSCNSAVKLIANMIIKNVDWKWTQWICDVELTYLLDYKIFLLCKIAFEGQAFSPTIEIERIWRYHLNDPRAYMEMSNVLKTTFDYHCEENVPKRLRIQKIIL